jgi:hypothetical protein
MLVAALTLALAASGYAPSPAAEPQGAPAMCTLSELFARPLVAGASISADHKSVSPGRVLARRYGSEAAIVKVARAGRYGRETVPLLTDERLKAASVLVGVDLFYWDGTDADPACAAGLSAINDLLSRASRVGTPLILANLPLLPRNLFDRAFGIPAPTHCRERLNAKLADSCVSPGCHLVDLAAVYREIDDRGGLVIGGKIYGPLWLLPDGRHPGPLASGYIGDRIIDKLGGPSARVRCQPGP